MLGHVAQSLGTALPGGSRPARAVHAVFPSATNETWTAPAAGRAIVRLLGAGGRGGATPSAGAGSSFSTGGGGGAYCEASIKVSKGDQITGIQASPGVDTATGSATPVNGGDSRAILPGGRELVAGGGHGGTTSTTNGVGVGGVATGGDVNSNGGNGGIRNGAAQKGAGTFGGLAGVSNPATVGGGPGGGAGGPSDAPAPLLSGNGGSPDGAVGASLARFGGQFGGGGAGIQNFQNAAERAGKGGDGYVHVEFYPS